VLCYVLNKNTGVFADIGENNIGERCGQVVSRGQTLFFPADRAPGALKRVWYNDRVLAPTSIVVGDDWPGTKNDR